MLKSQKSFSNYLKELGKLLDGTEFSQNPERLDQVIHTELLVPVIGAFSAGKSSLLNTLMGMEVLSVGIAPETELATELRYSPEPYLLAIKKNGEEERHDIDVLKTINKNSGDYSHLCLYINSPALQEIAPLVLVDMPGYGSSLDNHNKALSYYLPKGVHFIVVTSIEDGNITRAMIRCLEDVASGGGDFTFLLSKSNLRAPNQIEEVSRYINEQIETYFDTRSRAIPVGDQDAKPIIEAVKSINPDALFSGIFLPVLKNENDTLLDNLSLAMSAIRRDSRENEKVVRDLEIAMNRLLDQKSDAEQEAQSRYSGRLLDRCLRAVDQNMNSAIDELTTLAANRNNPNGLGNAISDIIRSSLAQTLKQEGNDITVAMIENLAVKILAVSPGSTMIGSEHSRSEELTQRVIRTLSMQTERISNWATHASEDFQKLDEETQKKKAIYKAILTTAAITTTVINPFMELAVVFLPEIIGFISSGNVRDKIRNRLIQEVFPDVKSKVRHDLPGMIKEQLDAMLDSVNAAFEQQISQHREIIEAHIRDNSEKEVRENERLSELAIIAESVKALSKQYLSFGE